MQQVNLNLVPGGVNPIVYASQNDDKRTIRFELVSGSDNDVYILNGNETITAKITKPDGTAITIPITNPGSGKHYVDLVNGASDYDQDGVYVGEVSLVRNAWIIGTGNFVLKVEADAYDAGVKILTASGNPASFNTDLADILADCVCELPYNSNGYKSATVINTSNTAVENETPYQLRQTPITANRCLEKLIGVSCAFNQLVQNGNFADTSNWTDYNATTSVNSNIATVTANLQNGGIIQSINLINTHKYLISVDIKTTSETTNVGVALLGRKYSTATTNWQNVSFIDVSDRDGSVYLYAIRDFRSSGWDSMQVKNVNVIDLTACFGSEVADYLYTLENS